MIIGNDWLGSYSRFSFDETKKYLYMLKEKGKYILDDEFNLLQEMQMTYIRRLMNRVFGNGSPDDGFKIVGTGASNDFTITAGNLIIDGWLVNLASNCLYSTQHSIQPTPAPSAPASLTTPGAGRADVVYLEMWFEEVDSIEDINILDPTLQTQTSCRLQQKWAVKVVEGGAMPAIYEIVGNKEYWRYQIATLNRLSGDATITVGMVVDARADLAYSNRLKLTGDEMTGNLSIKTASQSSVSLFSTTVAAKNQWIITNEGNVAGGRLRIMAQDDEDGTNSAYRLVIEGDGNVGIGTLQGDTLISKLTVPGLPVYANNAAAIAGGLIPGAFYRTGADPDPVMVVH